MKFLTKQPAEPQRPMLSEAMRAAEPRPPATEQLFTSLEKALISFERRETVLQSEIAGRTAELENVRVAKAAAQAGLAGLQSPPISTDPDSELTASLGDALQEVLQ